MSRLRLRQPAPKLPSRDARVPPWRAPTKKPANDNVPSPANDNELPQLPLPPFPALPAMPGGGKNRGLPSVPLPGPLNHAWRLFTGIDRALQHRPDDEGRHDLGHPTAPGPGWWHRHGPNNSHLHINYIMYGWYAAGNPEAAWDHGGYEDWPPGPQTGMMSGQYITPVPLGSPPNQSVGRYSHWREINPGWGQWIQLNFWQKYGGFPNHATETPVPQAHWQLPHHDYRPSFDPWAPEFAPMGLAGPMIVPVIPFAPAPLPWSDKARWEPLVDPEFRPEREEPGVKPYPITRPQPATRPDPFNPPEWWPEPGTSSNPKPWAPPRTPDSFPAPSSRESPVPRTDHQRKPPAPREKEVKLSSKFPKLLGGLMGATSEAGDFADAMWEALPKSAKQFSYHKGKPVAPNWRKKLLQVATNWDKMNWEKAFQNLLENQVQDAVLGRLASAQVGNVSHGLSTGHKVEFGGKATGHSDEQFRNPYAGRAPRKVEWWEEDQDWSKPKW